MNVVLLGYRGCGKTSIGRKLAGKLWREFFDTDDEARKRFGGRTIAEVWGREGEPAFRAAEVEVTKELLAKPDAVIALGGGTLMQADARAAVEAADAKRVYLKCSVAELARRLEADGETALSRPSLTAGGSTTEEIAAVLAEREPVYEAVADVVFDVTHCGVDDAVRHLTTKHL